MRVIMLQICITLIINSIKRCEFPGLSYKRILQPNFGTGYTFACTKADGVSLNCSVKHLVKYDWDEKPQR